MGLKFICRFLTRLPLLLPSAFLVQVLQAQDLSELISLADMNPESACLALKGRKIHESAIGLETAGARIEVTSYLQTGNVAGLMFCKVTGQIFSVSPNAPAITFEVNLPSNWNGKSLQFGGGGLNGVLITGLDHYNRQPESETTPLARGYVTLGSDSGHQSSGGFSADFMLFEEALRNFGHEQIKKTHDVAMLLIQARYGSASHYNYFIGGSQGGHEAFDAVQRYPQDYDGAVAAYPAFNLVMLHLSANQYAKALHANDGDSWINPEKARNFVSRVYEICDTLDNLQDGIISNIDACESATVIFKAYDVSNPVRCAEGQDTGNTCLSDAQLKALNVMDTPFDLGFSIYSDDGGNTIFPKWSPFIGSTFFDGNFPNLGAMGPGDSLQFRPGSATPVYAIAQNLNIDPMTEFNPAEHAGRIAELAGMMSATSVNLDTFNAKGGKLIFYHGLADDFIPFYSSIQYWDRLETRYERSTLDKFVRFYTIPGMGHQSGPFSARLSTLDALEAWVERDQAPGELQAIDSNQSSFGRSRPVCIYPQWPRYNGMGDIDLAESFTCVD